MAIGIPLTILLVTIAIAISYPQVWSVPLIKTLHAREKEPGVYIKPLTSRIKLPSDRVSDNSKTYVCYDLSFKIPWEVCTKKQKTGHATAYYFSKGRSIMVFDTFSLPSIKNDLVSDADPRAREVFKEFFRREHITSNYSLYKFILEISPDDLTLWTPWGKVVDHMMWLSEKAILLPRGRETVYSFDIGTIKGFQLGNPLRDRATMLTFFDAKDKEHEITVAGKSITQEDIDFIISTLHVDN